MLFIMVSGLPSMLQGEIIQKDKPERTKFSSLQKPLLFPGWGQLQE